jgi:hypothetical protein
MILSPSSTLISQDTRAHPYSLTTRPYHTTVSTLYQGLSSCHPSSYHSQWYHKYTMRPKVGKLLLLRLKNVAHHISVFLSVYNWHRYVWMLSNPNTDQVCRYNGNIRSRLPLIPVCPDTMGHHRNRQHRPHAALHDWDGPTPLSRVDFIPTRLRLSLHSTDLAAHLA